MNIGYKRVSTLDQSTARQLADIALDRVYEDFISGSTKDRPQLNRCLDALRAGDTLHVHSVDRLSRSMRDLLYIIDTVLKAGASIIIYSPRLEFDGSNENPFATFQLQILGSIAQLERSMIRERQREGIAQAKLKGTKSGKPFGQVPLDMTRSEEAKRLRYEGLTNTAIAKKMGLSRPSVIKLLRHANSH